ncbi:MAG: Zinc ribbon domain [Deltaproteobacteria bacterium]|nr:Zinc ribbon domain [Deltaproteobacteria bacterium]
MPTYSYLCESCKKLFEIRMSITEKEQWKPRCPGCGGGKMKQQLFGFSFGGSGGGKSSPGGCCPPGRGGCCG